jgi:two-component system cell cycle sensor histidine kinase/response regulator CckA
VIEQIQEPEKPAMTLARVRSNSPIGTILVVDDELELKKILVETLTRQGFEVTGCSSGQQALEELRGKNFDLLLTDLMMPEMDGISLLKSALEIDAHLVGIIMTGQGTIQTAIDAMKLGAFDYVLKPFRMQVLLPVLTRAMNVRHLRLENLQLRETVGIHGLCQTITFTLDPQTVLSKLADSALEQSDADEVSILLPTNDGKELYVAMVRGEKRERLLGERVPLQGSISSWVARERMPLILNGEVRDERFVALWPRSDIRSAVSIPMQVANKLIGIINLNVTNRLRPFTLGQMKALTILASTAAAALESASLYTQVQKAEEKYRSIFENAVEGIFQGTPEGRFITVNPSMARILGYDSPAEVVETITDISRQLYVHPEDRVRSARLQEERGVLQAFEFEAYRKDGEKIWLSVNRRSVRDENGVELYREGSIEDITERKQAEEERARLTIEIENQRERLDSLVSSVPGVVWEAWGQPDAATQRINFVSDYVETMLGYSVEEWLSTPNFWLQIVHPDDKEGTAKAAAADFVSSKSSNTLEFRWVTKDGRPLWVESTSVVIKNEEGRPVGVRGVTIDINERKRAEAELRFQKTLLESQSETSIDGILVVSDDREVLSFNQRFVELWGVSEEILRSGSDERALQSVIEKLKEPAEFLSGIDYLYQHPEEKSRDEIQLSDGRTFDRYSAPIKSAEDEYYGRVWFFRDITERKRADDALRESEERYRDLVENAHDIIYTHDLEGNYTSINKAGERITGYTREECLALNLAATVAPEDLPKTREMLRRKIVGEKVTAYDMVIIAKDGHRVAVEANTKLVYQDGVPVGVQGIARDVTERKQLEEQLRQSQKMEAIGQLAGGVAHDFNNLLTAINGYSSLALQRLEDGHPIRSYLEEVKKAGDRATNLTRQLLAFGRKQILQPLAINLNGVVADMNKMLRHLIGEDIVLTAKLDAGVGKVMADPSQIEQVLVNLIVNARDAMPRGGNLTIETRNVELDEQYGSKHVGVAPGKYVLLAVSDTGEGMSEEVRHRVFEPFFTTKEKGKGTGLGLSTVYGIVKQSGGNVWIYSEPGRGTTFKVYLPQAESEKLELGEKVVEAAPCGGSETILLVEDEEVVRGLARRILEQAGYSVVEASKGDEALRFCAEHAAEVDLLLTDVVMPEMSGKELADRLKPKYPELKMLFMSGYTDEAIVHHGVLDSSVEFIQKPFTPAALVTKVREVLDLNGKAR